MFGCVYFSEDNTLSVIKQSHKTVSCEKFIRGEACEVKWKGKPFAGIIISTGEKENEVKRTMHWLLKEVLNKWEGEDPIVPQLLSAEAKQSEEQEEAAESGLEIKTVSKRKKSEVPHKNPNKAQKKTYAEMAEGSISLLDTWRVIQGKDVMDFIPSMELRNVLQQLVKPSIQKEIQEMLKSFASKDESQYENIERNNTSDQSQLSTAIPLYINNEVNYTEAPANALALPISQEQSFSFSQSQSLSRSLPQPVFYNSSLNSLSSPQNQRVSRTWPANTYTNMNFSPPHQPMQSILQDSSPTTGSIDNSYIPEFEIPTPINSHDCQQQQNLNTQIQNTPTTRNTLTDDTPIQNMFIQKTPTQNTPIQNLPTQNTPIQNTPTHVQCSGTSLQTSSTEVRRSPRKNLYSQEPPLVAENDEDVTLMGEVRVSRKDLRNALSAALKNSRPAFTLMAKLLQGVFTILELANSRGLGIVKAKQGDIRPLLDATKIKACKDYVMGWARSRGMQTVPDSELNDAVTEQTSYARKKLKRSLQQ